MLGDPFQIENVEFPQMLAVDDVLDLLWNLGEGGEGGGTGG